MDRYEVTLEGLTGLLMHQDNLSATQEVDDWRKDPANKELSVKGDDRSPAWTWLGYLYHNTEVIGMAADNLMTMLREGGAKVKTGGGRGSETFKKQTQSGIAIDQEQWSILVGNKQIPVNKLLELRNVNQFEKHNKLVQQHGFELFVKRVRIGVSKHVRVRPFFRQWKLVGSLTVFDSELSGITKPILETILNQAGALVGIGDWRPGCSKSGPFGKFRPIIKKI